eukprot:857831-Rhodomonas_salina.1
MPKQKVIQSKKPKTAQGDDGDEGEGGYAQTRALRRCKPTKETQPLLLASGGTARYVSVGHRIQGAKAERPAPPF